MTSDGEPTPAGRRYVRARFEAAELIPDVAAEFAARLDPVDGPFGAVDVVAPVPSRTAMAAAFAAEVARRLDRPLAELLAWRREVPPLKGVAPGARESLVSGALQAGPVTGTVLLVDDVVRTTATLGEATRAVRAAGASRVVCLAMLRVA